MAQVVKECEVDDYKYILWPDGPNMLKMILFRLF